MATIQYGRLQGPLGFSRDVAIKRLHPQFAKDESFVSMLLDEARLSARIAHVNVVQTIDVLSEPGQLSIIMEYVHGESLAGLLDRVRARGGHVPVRIAVALIAGILHGLHAAHETRGEHGEPLHIVHRDVSPENILVASDGVARLVDFGVARAQGRSRVTPAGELKGKLAYMASEQYRGEGVDRRVDVYGASVVLWETLAGRDLFTGETDAALVGAVLDQRVEPPSRFEPEVPPELDAVVLRGLARDPAQRFATTREMALTLERTVTLATQSEVSDWLEEIAGDLLRRRSDELRQMRDAHDAASDAAREQVGTLRLDAPASRPLPASDVPARASGQAGEMGGTLRRLERARASLRALRSRTMRPWLALVGLALVGLGFATWVRLRTVDRAPVVETRELAAQPGRTAGQVPVRADAGAAAPASVERTLQASERSVPEATKPPLETSPDAGAAGRRPRRKLTRGERDKPRARELPSTPVSVDCTPPFWLDARGLRHIKRECLD